MTFQSNRVTFNYPASGLNNVGEYQASGLPFATQSQASATPTSVEFPYVTKFFTVVNTSADNLYVGFTENGALGENRFTILPSSSQTLDIRCNVLFFVSDGTADFDVVAGLTQIPAHRLPVLTGSAVYNSASTVHEFGYPGLG